MTKKEIYFKNVKKDNLEIMFIQKSIFGKSFLLLKLINLKVKFFFFCFWFFVNWLLLLLFNFGIFDQGLYRKFNSIEWVDGGNLNANFNLFWGPALNGYQSLFYLIIDHFLIRLKTAFREIQFIYFLKPCEDRHLESFDSPSKS